MINLFRILHIIFASMLIALMPVSMLLLSRIKKTAGTQAQLVTMGNLNLIGRTLGMIGGIGMLITGGALVFLESYKWFNFAEFPWLAWKQAIFVVILIINFSVVVPAGKQLSKLIEDKLASGAPGGATPEMGALAKKIGKFAPIMNLLALVNLILGTSKGIF
ncbi:MAG: DUF2269 family protein [Ignavibacteriota bacterium]